MMAQSAFFVERNTSVYAVGTGSGTGSVLPKLSSQGNLLAGAVTRVAVGFILNPFSVIKARFEVRFISSHLCVHLIRVICLGINCV